MAEFEPIRHQRILAFLRLHVWLALLAVVAVLGEYATGINDPIYRMTGFLVGAIPLVVTLVCLHYAKKGHQWEAVVPGILGLDTTLIIAQMYFENGLESGWAATPVLAVFMLPLFSDRRSDLWVLTGVEVVAYGIVFTLVGTGAADYHQREPNGEFWLYTAMGYTFFIICAGLLAGRASADVLNSQRQLQMEIDQATAALKAAQAQLVEQDRMASLGHLTAGLAHEINNPLTYVRTNVTNIERDVRDVLDALEAFEARLQDLGEEDVVEDIRDEFCLDDPRGLLNELIDDTSQGLDRVKQIIFDLRAFARLDEADRQPLQVAPDLERTLQLLGHRLSAGVEIRRDFAELPEIHGFPALLNQVFANLLHNACDAVTPDGGVIRISTKVDGDDVVIEFADNGPGVPDAIRDRIFDPFFTSKDVGEGTGLGLSISQRIVNAHGGSIQLADAPEGGALFRVRLPITGAPEQPAESAA